MRELRIYKAVVKESDSTRTRLVVGRFNVAAENLAKATDTAYEWAAKRGLKRDFNCHATITMTEGRIMVQS